MASLVGAALAGFSAALAWFGWGEAGAGVAVWFGVAEGPGMGANPGGGGGMAPRAVGLPIKRAGGFGKVKGPKDVMH